MTDYYCFRRVVQEQLTQCNRRNTVTVLRAVVKSHNGLKGTKLFACGCSGKILKNFSEFAGKTPCWGSFYCKVATCFQKCDANTETLTQAISVNSKKNFDHNY